MSDRYDLAEVLFPETPFPLMEHCILLGKRGSEAHGTYIPPSDPNAADDRDIMGVCVPPLDYYYGLKQWEGKDAINGCWDVVLYSFRKFIGLLCEQNPNVICMLWLRPEDYLYLSAEGRELIAHRHLFRSKRRAFKSFVGYANSQMKRMTHFGAYQGYMGAKRKALVDKHGYDCKNAAHLIRLLRMGIEFLDTGEMKVYRDADRAELVAIKTGQWTLTQVEALADSLFARCNEAVERSPLPEHPDLDAINALAVRLTAQRLASVAGSRGADEGKG